MSNRRYATVVTTKEWRSAMTIPRELKLRKVGDNYYVTSEPVGELNAIKGQRISLSNDNAAKRVGDQYELNISTDKLKNFSVIISNDDNEKLIFGFDQGKNEWYID